MRNVIEEFLIGLGVTVDEASIKKAGDKLDKLVPKTATQGLEKLDKKLGEIGKTITDATSKIPGLNKVLDGSGKTIKIIGATSEKAGEAIGGVAAEITAMAAVSELSLPAVGVALAAITAAAAAVTAGLTAAVAAIKEGGKALGNITTSVDRMALSLHTTTQNARSLQTVMDAMGIKSLDELKYVNLNPQQRQQFLDLRKTASENAPDARTKAGLDQLRKIGFMFQKFSVRFDGFVLKVVGAVGEILDTPLFQKIPALLDVFLDVLEIIAAAVLQMEH
jgi:hypothetical protein